MLISFYAVAKQVLILFVLILTGFICTKKRIFTESGIRGITDFLLYLVTPCVIVSSFHRDFDADMLIGLGTSALCAAALHFLNILLAHSLIHDKNEARERVLRFGTVFSNCGYMALPLQSALLGDDGVFFGAAYIGVFNLLNWTYGLAQMGGAKKCISLKKMIVNPGVIGIAAGLLFFLTPLDLPDILLQPVRYLAALNTPLPMIVIGFYLAGITSLKVLKDAGLCLSVCIRLIVAPVLALVLMYLCGVRGVVLVSIVIAASAPTAANTAMFALKFDRDTQLAVTLVAISTLISIFTMPLVVSAALYLQ